MPLLTAAPFGLPEEAWRLVGLTSWMVLWWLSEAVPLPATALLPLIFMPLLGISSQKEVGASYGDPLIFLFMAGFFIAQAMRRVQLHTRIALNIVNRIGTSVSGILGGFMLATAFLSMWISNTATAVMMFAVGMSIIEYLREHGQSRERIKPFGIALMLGIAYAASIGGIGTLIGTPPNTLLAATVLDTYGLQIDMARWMMLGVPFMLIMLLVTWLWLRRIALRGGPLDLGSAGTAIQGELQRLGHMGSGEKKVMAIFVLAALAWIFRPQLADLTGLTLSDTTLGLAAALLLFALRGDDGQRLLPWTDAVNIPWGVLLLFGGGLALAGAFGETGLAEAIGTGVSGLQGISIWWVVLLVTTLIVFLTELTSNTATAATFLPIMGAVASGLGENALLLMIPVAVAASAAFMMPVATPPNAIIFAYEDMELKDMVQAGLVLNLAAIAVIFCLLYFFGQSIFGIELGAPLTPLPAAK